MTHMKKIMFGLAVVAGLALFGVNNAKADCATTTVTSTAYALRAEGTTELAGTISVACTGGTATTASPSFVSVALTGVKADSGAGTTVTPLAGAPPPLTAANSVSNTCSASAPNNQSTFACPAITFTNASIPAGSTVTVQTQSNAVIFQFNETAGVNPTFTISGIRLNVAAANLLSGSVVTATVVTDGGIGSKSNSSVVLGLVSATLNAAGTQFQATALSIHACSPAPIPVGTPTTFTGGAGATIKSIDPTGANTLQATITEGTLGIWATQAQLIAGANGNTPDPAATQGIRFRIQVTGIPTGMDAYVPESLAGNLTGAALSTTAPGTYTLVSGANADGSGGTLEAAGLGTNFDLYTPVSGTITVVYEVATAPGASGFDAFTVPIALVGTAPIASAAISGSISVAPVGPPTITPAIPQFVAGTSRTIANVIACVSYLLFPWVVNTNDGNYNTGMAIANTSQDTPDIGTISQTGNCTGYFYPASGAASFTQSLATGIKGGQVATFVVSSLNQAFEGYVVVECSFSLAHGFAFIDNPIAGQNGFAEGYLAISVTNPRLGAIAGAFESDGH
jgi:hypothetical protein